MDQQPTKLWTKNFILAIVVNLFISMVFYLLMTTMALYAVDRFQASDTAAGFASSAFVLGSVIARIFAGRLLDIVGRRRLILVAMAIFVVASLLYIPTGSLAWLLVLRIVHGMAFGAGTTAVAASAQTLIPHARRGEGTGYFGLSTTLSTAVGPFVGVLLAGLGNYNAMFYFCAAASVAALVVALFLRVPELPAAKRPGRFRMTLSDIFETAALPISCVILLAGASYSGILTFLTSYAETRGSAASASVFFMVYAGAVLVSRLFAGRIQDRRGDNSVMYPTLISFVLGLLLLIPEPTILTIIGSAIFSGIGFGTVMSSAQAIAVKVSPTMRIGTATSTFFLMLDIGGGLGPIVLGALIPVLDYPGMYLMLAVVMVLATLLYFFAHGRSSGRAVRA
ncbi:MFS transporter [Arthrobacter sp. NPDC089319]|uniref:MFS transporter n=1 Tax=Arthrobacter sp. NPDC089319 TaxID=3155915 RepID=UPI00342E2435